MRPPPRIDDIAAGYRSGRSLRQLAKQHGVDDESIRRWLIKAGVALRARGSREQRPLIERFWVKVSPEPNSGCWLWTGAVQHSGHGAFWDDAKFIAAHRWAWLAYRGPIPAGLNVCHKCDVPACVNPDHLFLGTQADNLADMRRKGRQVWGEANGGSKLTLAQALEIRGSKAPTRDLAKKYGITRMHVARIRCGTRWGHIDNAGP